jgi:hypothetical protein
MARGGGAGPERHEAATSIATAAAAGLGIAGIGVPSVVPASIGPAAGAFLVYDLG